MLRRSLIPALVALLASTAISPAYAQRGHRDDDRRREEGRQQQDGFPGSQWNAPRQERAPQREVPLNVVLRNLKQTYGGEHLDARKEGNRYIISWITGEGRRLTIEVDVATGGIISAR